MSHSIMILRTWTVWNRSKPILALCGTLLLLEIGVVSWVSWDVGSKWVRLDMIKLAETMNQSGSHYR